MTPARMDAPPVALVSARTTQRILAPATCARCASRCCEAAFSPTATTDPIGRRFRVLWNQQGTGDSGGAEILLTVIGVVGNVRFSGVGDPTSLDVYAPNMQLFAGESFFVDAREPACRQGPRRCGGRFVTRSMRWIAISRCSTCRR